MIYLLKVSVSMLVLFVIYYVVFRKNTFHQANRICLLFVIVFSFAVPFISVTGPGNPEMLIVSVITQPYSDFTGAVREIEQHASNTTDVVPLVVAIVYLIGVLFFSVRFIKSIIILHKLGREADPETHGSLRIRRTDLKQSFTFFNTVFLPKGKTDTIVLHHEQAHVRQRHWLDLLLAEIALIMLWFNPVVRFVTKELRLQHEFLADRAVMATGVTFENYAQCLIENMSAEQMQISSASPFYSSFNKKRIIMMTKERTSVYKFMAYLCLLPASAALLMSFGKKQNAFDAPIKVTSVTPGVQNIPDIAPVELERVTKIILYGKRENPAPGQRKNHTGIDFELAKGSEVYATADGVVVFSRFGPNYGNYIRIKHGDSYSTQYSHLDNATVKQGDKITRGQVIGLVGNTGLSKIPHLHYEIIKDGIMVDPKDYLPKLPG